MQIGTGDIPACRLLCSAGRALRAFSRRGIEFPIRAVRTLKTTRVAIIAATCLITGGAAQAHEKWFYEGPRMPLRWDLLSRPMPLGFLAGVAVLLGVSYGRPATATSGSTASGSAPWPAIRRRSCEDFDAGDYRGYDNQRH